MMKKDKTEKINSNLTEYFKRRNYETSTMIADTSVKEAGMLSLLECPSPNSYTYSATSANHMHVERQFFRLKSWILEASEPCRSDLSQLLFPLFIHIYLELGISGDKPAATTFFNRNYQMFRVNRDYETTLKLVLNSSSEQVNVVKSLRSSKYQVKLADSNTLNYLLRYLKNSNNPIIIQILSKYIEIEVDDGSIPCNTFSDLENKGTQMKSSSTAQGGTSSLDGNSSDQLSSIESVINSVRQLNHPGYSVAVYSVINAYNGVCSASISPSVDTLACGFEDSVIKVWSMVPHWVHNVPSCPKNISFLACDDDAFVCKDEPQETDSDSTSSGRSKKHTSGGEIWSLRGHTGPVYDLKFTKDSKYLLSVSEDTYMRLWDLTDGECVSKYSGHNYPVFRVATSADCIHIATGSFDYTARLWNSEYLHPIRVFAGHNNSITSLAFHPNCTYLATGSWDHTIRLWQVNDGNAVRILAHHTSTVTSLSFAPNGKYLASGSDDGIVLIWDLSAGKVLSDLSHLTVSDSSGGTPVNSDSIVDLSWSKDSNLLVVGAMDGTVKTIQLKNIKTESSPGVFSPSVEGAEVHTVSCSNNSSQFSSLLHTSLTKHNYIASVVALQPDR